MNFINIPILVAVSMIVVTLIVYLVWKNQDDERRMEQEMNDEVFHQGRHEKEENEE